MTSAAAPSVRPAANPRLVWSAFFMVALIWGSSFLLIRVGVEQLSPFQLVFIRTAIAAVGLNAVLLARRQRLPFTVRGLVPLAIAGVLSTTIPFALITWGEVRVESGLASVLNATTALFTLIVAHFAFQDERITVTKAIGLVVGFPGVVVLFSRTLGTGAPVEGNREGQPFLSLELLSMLAIIVASMTYAISGTYSRKIMKTRYPNPTMVAAGVMLFGALSSGAMMLLSPAFGGQAPAPLNTLRPDVLLSVIVLGLLNTFVAYLTHFWVVKELGAAKASMVTYVSPVVAILLGWLILNEQVDWRLILGAAMIFSAIAIVNLRVRFRRPSSEASMIAPATAPGTIR